MEILFDRTNRDARLNIVIQDTEILLYQSRFQTQYCNTRHGNPPLADRRFQT